MNPDIAEFTLVTSPLWQYIKIYNYDLNKFDFELKDIDFEASSYVLIRFTTNVKTSMEETLKKTNTSIRYTSEYLPRLEEDSWQTSNQIRKLD